MYSSINICLSSSASNSAICASMLLHIIITCAPSSLAAAARVSENLLPVCILTSSTFATYKTGFSVSKNKSAMAIFSSLLKSKPRMLLPCSKCVLHRINTSNSALAFGSVLAIFSVRCSFLSTASRSLNCNSVSIISLSLTGFIAPSSRNTFSSSKHRITCIIASTSLIFPKNLLPNPSPLLAPRTRPAISTISNWVGTILSGFTNSANLVILLSGTSTKPTLGSMVQKR